MKSRTAGRAAAKEVKRQLRVAFPPRRRGSRRDLRLVDSLFEIAEDGRGLGQERFDLAQANCRPVLDPRLGKVVFDDMDAALAHLSLMIDTAPPGGMGRT